jgi:hypothetical protein
MKQIIIDKTVYGGMLVEKYFLILDDGTDIQVPYREWELYNKGDEYPKRLPESFNQAVKDIEEGKTVPLDTALNEEPPTESETFKKICKEIQELFDEKAKLEENLDRALKAWAKAISERTDALLERDEYKIGHDRYEKLRRLNLREMKELYLKPLRSLEHFDTLVDKL